MNRLYFICFSFLLIILTLISCLESKEGCLEPNATNFDIEANSNCCCVFPKLTLNHTISYNGQNIRSGTKFVYLLDTIVIDTMAFFTSNWILHNGHDEFRVREIVGDGQVDDLSIVDIVSTNEEIGTFDYYGTFDSLSYQIGVQDFWNNIDTNELSTDHPWKNYVLRPEVTPMLFRLKATKVQSNPITVDRSIAMNQAMWTKIAKRVTLNRHKSLQLNDTLVLEKLFHNLELFHSSDETFKTTVLANLSEAYVVN